MKKAWDETRARQLYEEGKSDLDIADMVGASVGAITAWRHRNRLKSKNPAPRKASERTLAPVKVPAVENPVQAPAGTGEPAEDTTNKPNLDAPNLCGPSCPSLSLGAPAHSLLRIQLPQPGQPNTSAALWKTSPSERERERERVKPPKENCA